MKSLLIIFSCILISFSFEFPKMSQEELEEIPETVLTNWRQYQARKSFIVGGEEVDPEFKYPWTADLYYKTLGHFCGGSLINETWVVTAAHCSTGLTPQQVSIQVHRHDLSKSAASEDGVSRTIQKIIIHSKYNPLNYRNDIALWQLSSPITNVDLVQLDEFGDYDQSGMTTVVGWGDTSEGGQSSDVLREVDVPIISNDDCNSKQMYNGDIFDDMICAGYAAGGKDSCQGDSGGPLFVNKDSNNPIQIGIVSWGAGCARPNKPGVYSRISYLYDFIHDTIYG